jgi:16S rRNA (guanine527-N7)-methyltransferase
VIQGHGPSRAFVESARRARLLVSRETSDRLEILAAVLGRWQRTINLVSRTTLPELWTRHMLDSAQLSLYLPADATTIADLGSGSGFPGLVLAALRPEATLVLIEADARKCAFLLEAARQMGLAQSVRVVNARVEAAPAVHADAVTARAVAPLAQLLGLAHRHRSDTTICLFHKGRDWRAELTAAMKDWDISCQPFTSITDSDAVILRIASFFPAGLRDRQPERRRRQDHDGG